MRRQTAPSSAPRRCADPLHTASFPRQTAFSCLVCQAHYWIHLSTSPSSIELAKIRETELRPTPTLPAIARTDRFATKCNSKIRFTFLIGTRLVGMNPRNLGSKKRRIETRKEDRKSMPDARPCTKSILKIHWT